MDEQRLNNTEPQDVNLDRILDAALAKHAAVEPRAGLEGRVLANLRAERSRPAERYWRSWGLAGAVAAVSVIAIALALRPEKPAKPTIADHHNVPAQTVHEPEPRVAGDNHGVVKDLLKPGYKRQNVPHSLELAVRTPKLDQFPSPQPLSEQELALAQYVRDFPQEAILVAQSQEESEVEMQKKMGITEPTSAEQQER